VKLGVIGAGSWGTALAAVAARNGHAVTLWAREAAVAEAIDASHRNPRYLGDVALPETIHATTRRDALSDCDAALLVVPAQALRAVCAGFSDTLGASTPVVICAKGIERDSGALMSEVVAGALPGRPIAVLSGPTFAGEVARGLPTAVTLACADPAIAARLVEALGSRAFRPYASDDVIGAEVAGAVKNVLAIACGITVGRGLGDNARAALITRGVAEIGRLSAALGGRAESLMGLAGIGDIFLTCSSTQSRNYAFGLALGRDGDLAAALAAAPKVVEGVATAASVTARAARHGADMPIARAVDAVLHRGADLDDEITGLLARPFRAESG
jgi:glycerol-3-phosphate dehydrogenase (NAD(P)+)